MRKLILAALGVFAVASSASAQQPQYAPAPALSRAAVAATPVAPASGVTVIRGNGGCTNCGPTAGRSFTMSGAAGGNCQLGYGCQNGCGSVKSDLAFHFGSCKNFFSPCGPTCGSLLGPKCPVLGFNQPFGTGWQCPRIYDSYTNH